MPRPHKSTVRITRITLMVVSLIIGAGLYLLVKMQVDELEPRTFQATEETMIDAAEVLAAIAAQSLRDDGFDTTAFRAAFSHAHQRQPNARIYEHLKRDVGMHCTITDAQGLVIFDSNQGLLEGKNLRAYNDVHRTLKGEYGARSSRTIKNDGDSSVLHVAAPIMHDGRIWGVLTIRKPQADVLPILHRRRNDIWWGTGLVGGGILTLIVAVFIWQYRPIAKLTQYARDIEQGKRPPLPDLGAGREVNTLANALESMRESLEGRKYAERYVRTLTHEMKSPVAAIVGAAELLDESMPEDDRKRFIGHIRAESARSERLLNRLLELSAIEGLSRLEQTDTLDFADIIRQSIDHAQPLAALAKVSLTSELPPNPVLIHGDRFILRSAVTNLLENAIDFSPPGTTVHLSLHTNDHAILTIDDQGPGIPEYAQQRVFERFFSLRQLTSGRKGTGLGLTLVREAATLHNGQAQLHNLPERGARATLELPLA